jgi:UDP-glucuronate 4-epimerase
MGKNDPQTISITGGAGFIGSSLIKKLVFEKFKIETALDSFKPSYNGNWCEIRQKYFIPEIKIQDCNILEESAASLANKFGNSSIVVHLAAFPGVRKGEQNSHNYLVNNVLSSSLVLEAVKLNKNIKAILFASSSSVYGDIGHFGPAKESDADGSQLKSSYSLTKWINESQFNYWQKSLQIPIFGLRFFTVFGEWGRPDMAYSLFTKNILEGNPVKIYGSDGGRRTMTHIDDAIELVLRLIRFLQNSNFDSKLGYKVFNIASTNSITAKQMADTIGRLIDKKVLYSFEDRPREDAITTYADLNKISSVVGSLQSRDVLIDLENYVKWHKEYAEYFI